MEDGWNLWFRLSASDKKWHLPFIYNSVNGFEPLSSASRSYSAIKLYTLLPTASLPCPLGVLLSDRTHNTKLDLSVLQGWFPLLARKEYNFNPKPSWSRRDLNPQPSACKADALANWSYDPIYGIQRERPSFGYSFRSSFQYPDFSSSLSDSLLLFSPMMPHDYNGTRTRDLLRDRQAI